MVSGYARGVDRVSAAIAEMHGHKVRYFYPQWGIYGKAAGPMRNQDMANYADALLLIWAESSPGSAHMLGTALKKGMPVVEYVYTTDKWYLHNVKEIK